MWFMGFPFSFLSDYAIQCGTSIGLTRRVCNTIGAWGPAIILVVISYFDTTKTTFIVIMFIMATGLKAGTHCGHLVNLIDISPNFAGLLRSVTHTLGTASSLIAPVVWGYILNDEKVSDNVILKYFVIKLTL